MKTFRDMPTGARIFVNHEAYEKKSSRTAYKLEWNHYTHDYDYIAGSRWFYMGMNEPSKQMKEV